GHARAVRGGGGFRPPVRLHHLSHAGVHDRRGRACEVDGSGDESGGQSRVGCAIPIRCGTSVPIPKFAPLCRSLACELPNPGTLAYFVFLVLSVTWPPCPIRNKTTTPSTPPH